MTSIRVIVSAFLGILTAFALFWVMQALVGVTGELSEAGTRLSVDFVRLRRDTTPAPKKREPPKREKPEQAPPPPEMNMAKNINPSDAVGEIVPMIDTGAQLEQATSLGAGGADTEPVPLVRVDPEYPPRAAQRGIKGYVVVQFTISPLGTVQDLRVVEAQPPQVFDRAVLDAVRRWKYNPRIENGVAVPQEGVQTRLTFAGRTSQR
jgi:protein TonB